MKREAKKESQKYQKRLFCKMQAAFRIKSSTFYCCVLPFFQLLNAILKQVSAVSYKRRTINLIGPEEQEEHRPAILDQVVHRKEVMRKQILFVLIFCHIYIYIYTNGEELYEIISIPRKDSTVSILFLINYQLGSRFICNL